MAVRAHVFVSGRVQGVYFREDTRRLAQSLGAIGWVRNRADGRVEAIFEGDEAQVRQLVEWCHNGPPHARVQAVTLEWEPATGEFAGFTVLPTDRRSG